MRRSLIAVGALALACAGQKAAQTGEEKPGAQPTSQEERQRIINQGYFDVANCEPRKLELPNPVNQEALIGFLVATRPQTLECLVDPANRGPAKETTVTVKATVTDAGPTYTATGENLTEPGSQCIQKAVAAAADIQPLAKGAAPVSGEVQVHHVTGGTLPGVIMGNNDASDIVGTIRLATPKWCECFADWKSSPPEELAAEITVTKEKGAFAANFVPPTTPGGQKVMACLKPKVEALTLAKPIAGDVVKVPKYPFLFIHSYLEKTSPNQEPLVQFLQMDSHRAQAQADAAIVYGARQNAVMAYDGLVKQYQKTKDWKLVSKLETGCQALIKADDAWAKSLEAQHAVEQTTLAKVGEFKKTDEKWADVEAETQKQAAETEKQVAQVKQLRTTDEAACPKKKYK